MDATSVQEVVVILAAGVGSRMGSITDKTNKCLIDLGNTTSINHILRAFLEQGVTNAIVVIGHYGEQIIEYVRAQSLKMNVQFVYNKEYDFHGCGYSLAISTEVDWRQYECVYITEADLLLSPKYIKEIVDSDVENVVLARDKSYIDANRSVVAIGERETGVSQFVYDPTHIDVYSLIEDNSHVLGESMQLWKVSGDAKECLYRINRAYVDKCNTTKGASQDNGLVTINQMLYTHAMQPMLIHGNQWLNLNTMKDVEEGKRVQWLIRK